MKTTWGARAAGIMLLLAPGLGAAQEEQEAPPRPRTLVMARVLDLLLDTVALDAEHTLTPRLTVAGTARVTARLMPARESTDLGTERKGLSLEPGVHVYLSGRAPEGFWIGPHLEVSTQHTTERFYPLAPQPDVQEVWRRTVSYGGSLRTGYTAILGPGLAVQVGVDLVARFNHLDTDSRPAVGRLLASQVGSGLGSLLGGYEPEGWSITPRVSLALGGAF
ncbi:DUF3575 domain-containing protein [Archangium primigenium]|uniref:DUF3575 domain-containing protein n=1 Tax=[Archangium] primigenium TaxID=2792470 RepID=UPI00195C9E48|nr:DUF3575 domain-containing protein [Archangium primigenium]MBM7119139.1 DUF3575 domain-containing protein [Archangium primigenium]